MSVKAVQKALEAIKNSEKAREQKKYMQDQFAFLGISTPDRRAATKAIWAKPVKPSLPEVITGLLALGKREYTYEAVELLGKTYLGKKVLSDADIRAGWALICQVADSDPWWDTIDFLGSQATGRLLARAGNEEIRREILQDCRSKQSEWFDRLAILHQLSYKVKTDDRVLERSINFGLKRAPKSPWIAKAAAQALRTFSDVGEEQCAWVEAFVQQSRKLPTSAKKEAVKNVEKNKVKWAVQQQKKEQLKAKRAQQKPREEGKSKRKRK